MPDAPTPLDLDAIEADLDARVPARDLGDRNHARTLIEEVKRLRAKVDRLMGLLEPYPREYPRVCNKLFAAETERDAALAEAKHYRTQRDEWFLRESGEREAAEAEVVLLRTRIRKARHQRDEARAEVARLTARPAPAWGEEAAPAPPAASEAAVPNDAVAIRLFIGIAALAAVRDHLPVKPDREAVARALYELDLALARAGEAWGDLLPEARTWYLGQANAVLDLLPGRSEATVKAEALREAADAVTEIDGRRDDAAARWLRARADRLAAEGGADRG